MNLRPSPSLSAALALAIGLGAAAAPPAVAGERPRACERKPLDYYPPSATLSLDRAEVVQGQEVEVDWLDEWMDTGEETVTVMSAAFERPAVLTFAGRAYTGKAKIRAGAGPGPQDATLTSHGGCGRLTKTFTVAARGGTGAASPAADEDPWTFTLVQGDPEAGGDSWRGTALAAGGGTAAVLLIAGAVALRRRRGKS
ncbi:hypothetical protein Q3V23_22655 [Streptomyces sp. VNUA116]|uniref:hypothetical protein n=1 Tax=Streptomyces sp. VNUA116 TaxID=3062449 RepID=UPI0026756E2A|nr:hypothetical protein [Streptomyces sp. VNUA116]WKU46628.1 hypothetical protein Q3V23_22655 [Streptomyces sp. VNUA116]